MNTKLLSAFFLSLGLSLAGAPSVGHASDTPAVGLKLLAEGFVSPLNLAALPDGSGRLLVADQVGTVHIVTKDGKRLDDLFFDARDRLTKVNAGFDERGLLGLALHPRFQENQRVFVYYSAPLRANAPKGWNHTSRIAEFKALTSDPPRLDPASEKVILEFDEPQENHNGGRMAFGPDGHLYVAVGDGGGANDNQVGHGGAGNGQNPRTFLGKVLRLDIDGGRPYAIPSDNPFADGNDGLPEIYALGFRNPWGMSFDRGGSRELFAADVGQNAFEEVNLVVKGGNYGWRVREGFHCFDPKEPNKAPEDCPKVDGRGQSFRDPILEYKNFRAFQKDPDSQGISVTGGYVYRGSALPQLRGKYVFADWSRNWALPDGVLFVATRPSDGTGRWTMEKLTLASPADGKIKAYVVAFGEDADGELYVLTNGRNSLTGTTGKVFKLSPM